MGDNKTEVILNLWYLADQSGLIISLKARAYVMSGTDLDKLTLLNERALLDYLIAEDFPLPTWVQTTVNGKKHKTMTYQQILFLGREMDLYEECMEKLQIQFSKIHKMKISIEPMVCITPLWMDDNLNVTLFDKMKRVNF